MPDDNKIINGRVTTREFYEKLMATEQRIMSRLDTMGEDILQLQISKAVLEGKADQKAVYLVYIISAIGIVLSLISLFK